MKTYNVFYTVNGKHKAMTVKAKDAKDAKAIVRKAHKTPVKISEIDCVNDWNFMN